MEAIYGFLGVIVGSFIPWIKEGWKAKRSRAERAKYLAVRVICVLDGYFEKCVEVVLDDGKLGGDESGRDHGPGVPCPPAPIFPDEVDWKSIDGDLMYRILTFPNSVQKTDNDIEFISRMTTSPPDFEQEFDTRQEGYAELGLEAMAITDHLRKKYKLPKREHNKRNADWNPKKILEEKLQKFEKQRVKNAAVSAPIDIMKKDSKGAVNE